MKVWEDCDLGYEDMERRRYHGEITEDEFYEWFMSHCEICPFMHTICMYGEMMPNGQVYDEHFLESTSCEENHRLLHQYNEQQIEDTINVEDWSNW